MKIFISLSIIFLLFLFPLLSVFAESEGQRNMKSLCTERWGSDYQMVVHCINAQVDAHNAIRNKYLRYLSPGDNKITEEERIIIMCSERSKDSKGRVDMQMALHCMDTQFEAYEKVKKY